MWLRAFAAGGFAVLCAATALPAQRAGSVELGAFGRYTLFSDYRTLEDGPGIGGRLGIFLSPRWSIEGDASVSKVDDEGGAEVTYIPVHGRINFNPTLTDRLGLILGVGGNWNKYKDGTDPTKDSDWGVAGLAGARIWLGNSLTLRLDGTVDYLPAAWNSSNVVVPNPPTGGQGSVEVKDRAIVGLQAGLSLVTGRQQRIVAAAPPPAPPPPPPVQPPPPPPPPPPASPTVDAAARAREILAERIHFDFDRFEIRPDAQAILDRKAEVLRANPNVRLTIEGHADERGSQEYNVALGQRRANAARDYLVTRHGIDAARLNTVSYGEDRPLNPASNEAAWALNRRDEFVVTAGGENLRLP